ncbi:hypothetical protein JH146_0936 [Methanocaldococcus bathoardescens]|uniref:Uncharacterized protein n=1 Tax=Methanocaldococcus bathoardescens TaxID=1301915 RepID=A0A076LC81_9EURY|nr:hypothetical protein [Methanocaldococcus bathoardescens]AIJ05781.1 hypothetical protein JH146_0936 [Methanocaldococcus bathoardescens]
MVDKKLDWGNNVLNKLDNDLLESEIIIDDILTKLDMLISEINSYVAEIQYGLNITNEKMNISIVELQELEKKLNDYFSYMELMRKSIEDTNNIVYDINNEMLNIKNSLEVSSVRLNNRYHRIEEGIKNNSKKLEMLSNTLKSINKNQKMLFENLKSTRILVYMVTIMTIVNMLINFNKIF